MWVVAWSRKDTDGGHLYRSHSLELERTLVYFRVLKVASRFLFCPNPWKTICKREHHKTTEVTLPEYNNTKTPYNSINQSIDVCYISFHNISSLLFHFQRICSGYIIRWYQAFLSSRQQSGQPPFSSSVHQTNMPNSFYFSVRFLYCHFHYCGNHRTRLTLAIL